MKSAKIALSVLIILSLLIPSQPVRADVAPPPAPQLGGLEPFGYQETNVQMVYERVEMEVGQIFLFSSDPQNRVTVTAYFTMHNQGKTSESMQVIFPLESFTDCESSSETANNYTYYQVNKDSFKVVIDGNIVPAREVVTPHPHEDCDKMTWAGFDVNFPVDQDVVIRVQYVMDAYYVDLMQNIEYVLETGAGWAGPIRRGYVVVKFPYTATTENVLSDTTPGYQFLYNEIFWSFENLEPTSKDNIQVSIVSPHTWQEILFLRRDLKSNPALPEKWIKLAQTYWYISTMKGVRSDYYLGKVAPTYEQGIAANPNSAMLYSDYAQFIYGDCCFYLVGKIDPVHLTRILDLVNKALALDPNDPTALQTLDSVKAHNPDLTFTPPATVPAAVGPLFTVTPSVTPTVTMTFSPEELGPEYVTVVQTELVTVPASTATPAPKVTRTPTPVVAQDKDRNGASAPFLIFGALVLFVAGIGAGIFWQRRK
jgi:hypothetical protein